MMFNPLKLKEPFMYNSNSNSQPNVKPTYESWEDRDEAKEFERKKRREDRTEEYRKTSKIINVAMENPSEQHLLNQVAKVKTSAGVRAALQLPWVAPDSKPESEKLLLDAVANVQTNKEVIEALKLNWMFKNNETKTVIKKNKHQPKITEEEKRLLEGVSKVTSVSQITTSLRYNWNIPSLTRK